MADEDPEPLPVPRWKQRYSSDAEQRLAEALTRYHLVFGTEGFDAIRAALEQLGAESSGGKIEQSSVMSLLKEMYTALPLASGTDPRRVRVELSDLLDFAMRWCHGEA